jgi:Tol biopolymer transport system component
MRTPSARSSNTCWSNPVEEISALFVVNLDGTGRLQITPWGARNGNADWSPDGPRIVYEGGVDPCRKGAYAVVVVDADGKHLKRLTNDSRVTGNPLGHDQGQQAPTVRGSSATGPPTFGRRR